ncbi:MAG: T9SS type A sorting domain-containing protein [Bacteroidales bacterium]|nr:T9SS type A sorting domain-containing protein [Bacteroidales bacterium]
MVYSTDFLTILLKQGYSQDKIITHISTHNQNHFGWSISGDNGYIGVSDPRDSIHHYANGCVNIYKKNSNNWDYLQTLQNPDLKPYDFFGHRTCMFGNYLAVSSIGDNIMGFMSGAVHIFHLENGLWKYDQTLREDIQGEKMQYGESLFLNDKYLVVGAPGAYNTGVVYVYGLLNTTFHPLQKITNPYPLNMQFGKSVTMTGDQLIIGAPSANMAMYKGTVFIYDKKSIHWEKTSEIQPDDEDYGALFGFSISAEKNKLLISAPHANLKANGNEELYFSGKVFYFKNMNGKWTKEKEFSNPEPSSHDLFGSDVLISDSILYISAPKDDVEEKNEGTVFIYQYKNGAWEDAELTNDEENEHEYFSNSFYVFDRHLFVGSAGARDEKNRGRIFYYDVTKVLNVSSEEMHAEPVITFYPNPADRTIKVSGNNNSYRLKICSTDGKIHMEKSLKGDKEIDVSNLSEGLYIVSLIMNDYILTEELIIQHR